MAKWILFTLAAIAFAIVEIGGFIEKMRRKAENSNVVHAQEIGFWVGTVLGGAFLFFAWNTDSLASSRNTRRRLCNTTSHSPLLQEAKRQNSR